MPTPRPPSSACSPWKYEGLVPGRHCSYEFALTFTVRAEFKNFAGCFAPVLKAVRNSVWEKGMDGQGQLEVYLYIVAATPGLPHIHSQAALLYESAFHRGIP